MAESILNGKRILAVDDEPDISDFQPNPRNTQQELQPTSSPNGGPPAAFSFHHGTSLLFLALSHRIDRRLLYPSRAVAPTGPMKACPDIFCMRAMHIEISINFY
jgi:hypothetical protein